MAKTKKPSTRTVPTSVEMSSEYATWVARRVDAGVWVVSLDGRDVGRFRSMMGARRWCRSAGAKIDRVVREPLAEASESTASAKRKRAR